MNTGDSFGRTRFSQTSVNDLSGDFQRDEIMSIQAFFQRLALQVFRVNSYVCVLALVMLMLVGGLLVGPSTRKAKASTLAGAVWAPLGFGLNNFVTAIAVSGSDVYVGGAFTAVCGNAACNNGNVPINHIARWDASD
jgi:hypothetical protein